MSNCHPAKRLMAPDGSRAKIDVLLVPLIQALWENGYETIGCCQDLGESAGSASERKGTIWMGYALLEMPVADTLRLLDVIKATPQFESCMHWADQGAWEVSIPVIPMPADVSPLVGPWAQIHFPAEQIEDLAKVLLSIAQEAR